MTEIDPQLLRKMQNPKNWPGYNPAIIAHDVARSRDRSTAVLGGVCPFNPRIVGIETAYELPLGLLGHHRAEALSEIDRSFGGRSLIFADVSNDATYAEVMFERFGQRFIGLHITRSGNGMEFEVWQVRNGQVMVYTIGRTQLFDILHNALHANQVRITDSPENQLAYAQLNKLEVEYRDTGRFYTCSSGEHDDLGISYAILVQAALHPHVMAWRRFLEPRRVCKPRPAPSPLGWT
jgi:hypothetical protein